MAPECGTLPFDPGLGRQIGHSLEGRNEFRAAIGIAGIVHRVDTNEDIAGTQHFSPAQSQRQEYGIARRHIRYGMPSLGASGTSILVSVSAEPPMPLRLRPMTLCSTTASCFATRSAACSSAR